MDEDYFQLLVHSLGEQRARVKSSSSLSVLFGDTLGVPVVALEAHGAVHAARGALPLVATALGPALGASVIRGAALYTKGRREWKYGLSGG